MKYFVDFEATQFSNEIISIGCVRENGDEFYSLVKPKKKLTSFITQLTGITEEMLENAPSPEEVFSNFFNWCDEYSNDLPIFYCYGNCDVNFVKKNFNNSQNFRAKSILGYIYSSLLDYEPTVRRHFGLCQAVGLIKVANYYNKKELEQSHNALDDARMLKFVHDSIRSHSEEEDENAFPDYKKKKTSPIITEDWSKYKVKRLKGGKVLQEYDSLAAAVAWVIDQLPDNEQKELVVEKNIANKIKRANNKKEKYIDYKWKVIRMEGKNV